MAHGKWPAVVEAELPSGAVLTASGRVSAARERAVAADVVPFSRRDLLTLDNALTEATRRAKVRFNIYVGDLGADSAAGADALFPGTPEAARSVLLAVSPEQKVIEIRSGSDVSDRANSRVAQLGVTAALSSFKQHDLIDGLISAVRVMSQAIGR